MGLPVSLNKDAPRGPTRLDEAKQLITELLDGTKGNVEWSLATFGGAASEEAGTSAVVRQGFTADVGRLKTEIGGLRTWGVTPLAAALEFGLDYSRRHARLQNRALLVVTDGVGTSPYLFEMPPAALFAGDSTRIIFASVALPERPRLSSRIASWVRETGGLEVEAATSAAVEAALSGALTEDRPTRGTASTRQSGAGPVGDRSAAAITRRQGTTTPVATRPSRGGLDWVPVLFVVLGLLPLALLFARRGRRQQAAARALQQELTVLKFGIERSAGSEEREYTALPIILSEAPQAQKSKGSVSVTIEGGAVALDAPDLVLVNGVGVRHRVLRSGDRVRVPGGVWTFHGEEKRTTGSAEPPLPHPLPYYLAFTVLCAGALAFAFLVAPGFPGGNRTQGPANPSAILSGAQGSGTRVAQAENDSAGGVSGAARAYLPTQMVAPGVPPSFFKADVMFIHTHPDDESIDFGGLMALESRSGHRVVTVLFTDGTAGLDQYPNRPVGGIYPANELRGSALAKVRVEEAEAAMSILGSQAYVRLGLLNNPYDSIREILPLREVLRRWGGETEVVARLVSLLEGYQPAIVVSPDKHHRGVFKHFEHEAVGYVTDEALRYLRDRGMDFVRAHLVAVDPMLRSQYPSAFGIDVMAIDRSSGLAYRAIQVAALKTHETQRDASVIAVEVLPNFADEYYVAQFWDLPVPPSAYFAQLPSSSLGIHDANGPITVAGNR
ncbi:MAG TPA: PIG-L family deacetylase, partial [Spirochaetia bacterium]|nr:PIG-L family deacetylase [Spirochaetia bacterium]